ncbi:helix-turn-helix domain-containing protein [Chloroflexota bacterium]
MKGGVAMTGHRSTRVWDEALTLSVRRTAQMLGISEYLAREMAKRGELPTIRLGRLVRVPKARLIAMVNGE